MNRALRLKIYECCNFQADFAMKLRVDEGFVSRVIHGRKVLKESEKTEWSRALNCSVDDIFKD